MWSRRTIIGAVCLVVATVGSASASGLPCEFARAAVCALHSLLSLKRRPQKQQLRLGWPGPQWGGWQMAECHGRAPERCPPLCRDLARVLDVLNCWPVDGGSRHTTLPSSNTVGQFSVGGCVSRVGGWGWFAVLSLFHRLLLFTHSITIATTDPAVLFTYPWLCLNVVLGRR